MTIAEFRRNHCPPKPNSKPKPHHVAGKVDVALVVDWLEHMATDHDRAIVASALSSL
jgi:hypothetical protein